MGLLKVLGTLVALPFTIVSGTLGVICHATSSQSSACDATQAVETAAEASKQSSDTKKRARED